MAPARAMLAATALIVAAIGLAGAAPVTKDVFSSVVTIDTSVVQSSNNVAYSKGAWANVAPLDGGEAPGGTKGAHSPAYAGAGAWKGAGAISAACHAASAAGIHFTIWMHAARAPRLATVQAPAPLPIRA